MKVLRAQGHGQGLRCCPGNDARASVSARWPPHNQAQRKGQRKPQTSTQWLADNEGPRRPGQVVRPRRGRSPTAAGRPGTAGVSARPPDWL